MPFTPSEAHSILKTRITSQTYVGLLLPDETDDNDNVISWKEPDRATTDYARVQLGDAYDASINSQISNKLILFFNETLAPYGTIVKFGLFNSATGGTYFFIGDVKSAAGDIGVTIGQNYVPIFRKHKWVVALDKKAIEPYE